MRRSRKGATSAKPRKARWRKYLLVGGLACAALITIVNSKTCSESGCGRLQKTGTSDLRPTASRQTSLSERLKAKSLWKKRLRKTLKENGYVPWSQRRDPILDMIERDIPEGSLECPMPVGGEGRTPPRPDPDPINSAFMEGAAAAGIIDPKFYSILDDGSGDAHRFAAKSKHWASLSKSPDELYWEGYTGTLPRLADKLEALSESNDIDGLLAFTRAMDSLDLVWSENGKIMDAASAYLDYMGEGGFEIDDECFARLSYPVMLMREAFSSMAFLSMGVSENVGDMIGQIPEGQVEFAMQFFADAAISYSMVSDDPSIPRRVFDSLPEDMKEAFARKYNEFASMWASGGFQPSLPLEWPGPEGPSDAE